MKTYKEFRPTDFDQHIELDARENWYVLPVSRTRDTGVYEESNFEAALKILGGESDTVEVHRFGHWGPGWFEIILVHPSRLMESEEIESSLEEYPLLDDEDISRREFEAAGEDWESYGQRDFLSALSRQFSDTLTEDEIKIVEGEN